MASGEALARIGLVADAQYAYDCADVARDRHFRTAPSKLGTLLGHFRSRGIKDVVNLGDTIDHGAHNLPHILGIFAASGLRVKHVLGNHDLMDVDGPEKDPRRIQCVINKLGLANGTFYAQDLPGNVRLVCLDGNMVSMRSPELSMRTAAWQMLRSMQDQGAINAHPSNGALGDMQHEWLQGQLDDAQRARQRVIIASHFPVHNIGVGRLWDGSQVMDTIEYYPNVAAVISGHEHAGDYYQQRWQQGSRLRWTHHLTMRGLVQTEFQTSGAVMAIAEDGIIVQGIGRQPSAIWNLPPRD